MSAHDYILIRAAEDDLRAILRYTRCQWGSAQVRRYAAQLERCIARLATNPASFTNMDAIYPALRVAHCRHHYVFCLPRKTAPALIVAILHERMDLVERLAGRLGK